MGDRLHECQTSHLFLSAVSGGGQRRGGDRFLLKQPSNLQRVAGGIEAVIVVVAKGHPGSCWMGGRFQLRIEKTVFIYQLPPV